MENEIIKVIIPFEIKCLIISYIRLDLKTMIELNLDLKNTLKKLIDKEFEIKLLMYDCLPFGDITILKNCVLGGDAIIKYINEVERSMDWPIKLYVSVVKAEEVKQYFIKKAYVEKSYEGFEEHINGVINLITFEHSFLVERVDLIVVKDLEDETLKKVVKSCDMSILSNYFKDGRLYMQEPRHVISNSTLYNINPSKFNVVVNSVKQAYTKYIKPKITNDYITIGQVLSTFPEVNSAVRKHLESTEHIKDFDIRHVERILRYKRGVTITNLDCDFDDLYVLGYYYID